VFVSLRSRLWLSYALVITVALGVVSVVLIIFIFRNPMVYRQAASKLLVVQGLLLKNQDEWADMQPSSLQPFIENIESSYDTRITIYDSSRRLIADSGSAEYGPLKMPRLPRVRISSLLRDGSGQPWLYNLRQLENKRWLLISVPRPNVPVLTIIRDELFMPVIGAAIAALLLSLILAFMFSRWVADPLQRMVSASKRMPILEAGPITVDGPKEVQELISGFNDMTSRVQESQLSQRQFVANVSHELKTPLTVIQGFSQAILDGTADTPETQKQAAQVINEESNRMHRLVVDLLDLARMDAGTFILKHDSIDIELLLKQVMQHFDPQAQQAKLALHLSGSNLPRIYGDSDKLAQVFTNLVDNAVKFSSEGGVVEVIAASTSEELIVEVKDSGVGIPPQSLSNIFDRFYQADRSRMGGESHSAGLGLAIAREIVQAHHGTITAQSILGQGSTFTVCLPLSLPDTSTINRRRKTEPKIAW
jgi:signal transduction histidine kinase